MRRRRAAAPGCAHRTPVLTSRTLDALAGARGVLQVREPAARRRLQVPRRLQRARQLRGGSGGAACWPSRRATTPRGSRWRRGCWACRRRSCMPHDAPARQGRGDARLRRRGGLLRPLTEDREAIAARARRRARHDAGAALRPPAIIAGQGTAALELIEEVARSTCCRADRRRRPDRRAARSLASARCAGIQMSSAWSRKPATTASGRSKPASIVHIAAPKTIADGAQTTALGELTFPSSGALCDDIVTVSDGRSSTPCASSPSA